MQPKGDKQIIKQLISSVRAKKNVHAYLFAGEKGLFKRESAYYFAEALLCENTEQAPCGACAGCIQAQSGNNPDIIRRSLSDMTSKKSIGVDEIRLIIEDVYTKPFKSEKKVYIIEDGDDLTSAAQNALLKVIEEPPPYAVFIICATDLNKILITVQSRCRIMHFTANSASNIRLYVNEHYPQFADKSDFIESFCAGAPGKADEICSGDFFELRADVFNQLCTLLASGNEMKMLGAIKELEKYKKTKDAPDRIGEVFEIMSLFLMDMLKISTGARCINTDYEEKMRSMCRSVSRIKLINSVNSVMDSQKMMSANVSGPTALKNASLGIYYN